MFDTNLNFSLDIWLDVVYPKIRKILNIPVSSDHTTVKYFADLGIKPKSLELPTISKSVCFGAGPNLSNYHSILKKISSKEVHVTSADGATRWLLENNFNPDLVITDLDGLSEHNLDHIINNNINLQVLVHGDNMGKVENFIELFDVNNISSISFVTQGAPVDDWTTSIGFTDGDRATSVLCQAGYQPMLLGFDLDSQLIGKYSKPHFTKNMPITDRKKKKLSIAKAILSWVDSNYTIYNDGSGSVPGQSISLVEFLTRK